jgi:hypothetical protein
MKCEMSDISNNLYSSSIVRQKHFSAPLNNSFVWHSVRRLFIFNNNESARPPVAIASLLPAAEVQIV